MGEWYFDSERGLRRAFDHSACVIRAQFVGSGGFSISVPVCSMMQIVVAFTVAAQRVRVNSEGFIQPTGGGLVIILKPRICTISS